MTVVQYFTFYSQLRFSVQEGERIKLEDKKFPAYAFHNDDDDGDNNKMATRGEVKIVINRIKMGKREKGTFISF